MKTTDRVQAMLDELTTALADAEKFDNGNAAAGTRVRKAMQNVKASAQDVRAHVQAAKNSA